MGNYDYDALNRQADSFDRIKALKPSDSDIELAYLIEKETRKIYNDFNLEQFSFPPVSLDYSRLKSSNYTTIAPLFDLAFKEFQNIGLGMHKTYLEANLSKMDFYSFESNAPTFFCFSKTEINDSKFTKEFVGMIFPEMWPLISRFCVCHEFSHMLKDKYLEESRLYFTKCEVIPVALELITAFKCDNNLLLKCLIRDRFILMYHNIQSYDAIRNEIQKKHTEYEKRGLTFSFNQLVCYLNSFYYSLILFRLYLDEPEYIIELIDMVLSGQITSEEMFDYLDKKKFDNYASDGLAEIKKYLK